MFQTPPPSMVNSTRATVRKQKAPAKEQEQSQDVATEHLYNTPLKEEVRKRLFGEEEAGCSEKNAHTSGHEVAAHRSASHKGSSARSSTIRARKAKLELEAAEAKARIEMQLIEKRLQADMAAIEDKYSSRSSSIAEEQEVRSVDNKVENWLERSHEQLAQPVQQDVQNSGELCPPVAVSGGTEGTIAMLASALKDMAAVSKNSAPNAKLLSRISTQKDLPTFAGDPMDWLHFKQAYEESTVLCHFSPRENLWRLRNCLRGPAKEAVTALLISATTPDVVMSTLELQFGNPDVIIHRIVQDINRLPAMAPDYHKDIVKFSVKVQNFVSAVLAIGEDEYLKNINIMSAVLSKFPTVLLSKWTDYSYPRIIDKSKPKLLILSDFLREEAVKTSKTAINIITCSKSDQNYLKRKSTEPGRSQHHVMLQSETPEQKKCRFCHRGSPHGLPECKYFKKALRKDRWRHVKQHRLCFKCLLPIRHDEENICTAPVCDFDTGSRTCGLGHHRLLHYEFKNTRSENTARENTDAPTSQEQNTETVTHIREPRHKTLLQVVPIQLHGPRGTYNTSALLDGGSTLTMVSSELVARVGLRGHKKTMRVCGAFADVIERDSEIVELTISNRDGKLFTFTANAMELHLPSQDTTDIDLSRYGHLNEIRNELVLQQFKPEILIGQDNYELLLPMQVLEGKPGEPYATLTPLGWCVHGLDKGQCFMHSTLLTKSLDCESSSEMDLRELNEQVRRYFAIDSLGVTAAPRENADDLRALAHLEKTSQLKEGRWYVGLPWKDCNSWMPDSFQYAMARLKNVERKMKSDSGYAARYKDRIDHLFENDFASVLTQEEPSSPRTWYLPHFGVDNPNKGKLRLVFDAAAKYQNVSLNSYLLKGPDLLVSLLGIMMRFREHRIGITGDIKDMFLRIKIIAEDQDALRFLWRDNPNENIKVCAMTSLIFGANCSPFIAQFIKNKNARRYEASKPAAVHAIYQQHYMDDYIQSVQHEDTAKELIQDISFIHSQGGFEMRNWTSNSQDVLSCMPTDTLGPTAVKFNIEQLSERTLGLIWWPKNDTLGFDVSFKRIPVDIVSGEKIPTKREMLRVVMSIFDVFGLLSPFTIKGKIILQETWSAGIDWDDLLTDELYAKWAEWLELLKRIDRVCLPRFYHTATREGEKHKGLSDADKHYTYDHLELHVFVDASTKAMCAVAYWRWVNHNKINVSFIASKCKVAPIKRSLTVPRLELQAAVIGARLAETVIKNHTIKPERKYFWSDSTTVLHWIRDNTRSYQAFVAHRLGEIDELTCASEWRYIPTTLNIADVATREGCDLSVFEGEWFYGPSFLCRDKDEWPADLPRTSPINSDRLEYVAAIKDIPIHLPACPDPERFSSWIRLLKSTCMVLAFADKCRKRNGEVDGAMMERAERLLMRYAQAQSFSEDLEHLQRENTLDKKSKLLTLTPFLDEYGVLRVGGRIDAAPGISRATKQPTILDGRSHIAKLIVMHYHRKYAHGNQETVVNELKQTYWILRLRPTVKNVVSKCLLCRIRKAQPQLPRMGNLPEARVAHHQRPFTHCGVDLFGPMKVAVGRGHNLRYGVLFTCMTIRAVHIELVHSLTTDSLILAARRMAARRSWPKFFYSDNGTNLRGAATELKRAVQELDQDMLKNEAVNYGTTWVFQPPLSPHWGGAFERLIRSVKTSLKVVLKERTPREEVLMTLMTEVEQIVNSRPLTHVSVEPTTAEAITPNHFLLGTSSNLPVPGVFDDSGQFLRKQWRISQLLADQFWRRWVKEVLPQMLPRKKWQQESQPLQVGDVVVIVDPNMPRGVWPRGVIEAVLPGRDGRVRVVDVRTKSGLLRRSTARVAKLPVGEEC